MSNTKVSHNQLKNNVIAKLRGKGFTHVKNRGYIENPTRYMEAIIENVPYENIYSETSKTLLLRSNEYHKEIRIICIRQKDSGTVDQKYPFVYLNCVEKIVEPEIIIVLDANGAKQGAVSWLKEKCESETTKNIQVLDYDEFEMWVDESFK